MSNKRPTKKEFKKNPPIDQKRIFFIKKRDRFSSSGITVVEEIDGKTVLSDVTGTKIVEFQGTRNGVTPLGYSRTPTEARNLLDESLSYTGR